LALFTGQILKNEYLITLYVEASLTLLLLQVFFLSQSVGAGIVLEQLRKENENKKDWLVRMQKISKNEMYN